MRGVGKAGRTLGRPGPRGRRRLGVAHRCPERLRSTAVTLLCCLTGAAAVGAVLLGAQSVEHTLALEAPDGLRAQAPGSEPAQAVAPQRAGSRYTAPRPRIVPRTAWVDATMRHRQPPPRYDDKVVAVFVHHTDSPNDYDCADVPRIIRHLYAGQTGARNWDDIGYNFLVDRCGTIYEGRAGGVDRPVTGAHTQGFNHRTAGIAAIGTFSAGTPVPRAMTDAIAAVAAWKLGLAGVDPRSSVTLVSSNTLSRYPVGTTALLPALAGHNDGFRTDCPGAALTVRLPAIREAAARLQGRRR
ncbi:peptidoglycan recognition protein family protein [Streptomyces spiralis]|uniref:peptidoglycan recognition protein family protein n=1 Tax=Streptomyces spiralis TaxID=66376 RepID=UPI001E2CCEC5|nr:peptidoglycan recognition protein [Streptomyces spiralis]